MAEIADRSFKMKTFTDSDAPSTPSKYLSSRYFSPKKSSDGSKNGKKGPSNFSDPLFCFYFRSFARLYHRLSLIKPLLIQGEQPRQRNTSFTYTAHAERVADDPWKVLVAVTLLNKTAGKAAIPVFWGIIAKYPTPLTLSQGDLISNPVHIMIHSNANSADETDLTSLIRPLGLQSVRAKRLIRLSTLYLQFPPSPDRLYKSNAHTDIDTSLPNLLSQHQDVVSPPPSPSKRRRYPPTPVSHLPGTGRYALDSYRIFCTAASEPEAWKHVMPTDKELVRYLVSLSLFSLFV